MVIIDMHYFDVQVMMSLRGADLPLGKTTADQDARQEVYDIICRYVMSEEDMDVVSQEDPQVRALWFETFTNSQKGMFQTSLNSLSKSFCAATYFPPNGASPLPEYLKLLGLPAGKSFLGR